eukprot:TRINITY_DN2843_c0_g2_i1.p1 TRINITY_DN2843_c0_g2~~TRINITY_DN2843_c0_g2_i1.p1  ORF type:complete len:565 (-),score=132.34 TRINITY_DN2843_c0_g2_i1:34-1728(-)
MMYIVRLLVVAQGVNHVCGSAFLQRLPLNMSRDISDPEFKKALFAEIEDVLGDSITAETKQRVAEIEDVLRPMFTALPKNTNGKLAPAAVQYMLRRLFMRRQGWSVEGLEPTAEGDWDPSRASLILEEKGPGILQEVLGKHIGEDGSGLHEIAVVAAMMEHVIFEEMLGKLQQAYFAKQVNVDSSVSPDEAEELVALHVAAFIRARDVSQWNPQQIERFESLIYTLYPNWPVTKQLMSQVQQMVAPGLAQFTFDDVASVSSEVGGRFAHWQNEECKNTKSHLLELEEKEGSGRVRLVDFYNAALYKGRYQFTETITYLRQLGILDESDEKNPRIIIPNYITGKSNCVARAEYYSVCCLDECEDLFGQLERYIGKPEATPEEIENAGGALNPPVRHSQLLRRRLHEVATHHGGVIPLHGRLFAQWMHLAYPRECVYPHRSGTVYYRGMEQWEEETGERSGSTIEEIELWSEQLSQWADERSDVVESEHEDDHIGGMWSMEEELIVQRHEAGTSPPTKEASSKFTAFQKAVIAVITAGAVSWAFFGAFPSGKEAMLKDKELQNKWV